MAHHSPGQIMVLYAGVIAVLLGAIALGTDVAVMYLNWEQLQKAADASAIAGASQLTGQPDASGTTSGNAKAYAAGYACLNGINDTNAASDAGVSGSQQTVMTNLCTANTGNNPSYTDTISSINVDANNSFIQVSLKRQLPYFFGRVIGLTAGNVAASAKAAVAGNVNTVNDGLFPAGVQCATDASGNCNFSCNPISATCNNLPAAFNKDQVFAGVQGASYLPGNWGWLSLTPSSSCPSSGGPLAQTVACGGSDTETIGVSTKPGQTVGQINHGWDTRISDYNTFVTNNPSCKISYASICGGTSTPCPGDPLAVVVPLVNFNAVGNNCPGGGTCNLTIQGFAELYLDPTQTCLDPGNGNKSKGCGSNASLEGCFIKSVAPDTIGSSGAPNTGVTSAPTLVQ
jgi:Flp pilus assembly protein TadG